MTIESVLTAPPIADSPLSPEAETAEIAQQRLNACPYSSLRSIECRSYEGVLILTGVVPSFFMKQFAQECVRMPDCVEQIDNRLIVLETPPIRGD